MAAHLLSYSLHSSRGQQYIVKGGQRWWVAEFFGAHTLGDVGLRTKEHRHMKRLTIACFQHSRVGCFVWWSWDSLWEFAGFELQKETCSRFVLRRWSAWADWLRDSLQLPGPTLRKARPYSNEAGAPHNKGRVLSFQPVSICGLIALLVRMCESSVQAGGLAVVHNRRVALRTLDSLLERVVGLTSFRFLVCFDGQAHWDFPAPPSGRATTMVPFLVSRGRVVREDPPSPDFHFAAADALGDNSRLQDWLDATATGDGNGLALCEFIRSLLPFLGIFKQIVWQVGRRLDMEVRSEGAPGAQHDLWNLAVRTDPLLRMAPASDNIGGGSERSREARLVKHWLAGHCFGGPPVAGVIALLVR